MRDKNIEGREPGWLYRENEAKVEDIASRAGAQFAADIMAAGKSSDTGVSDAPQRPIADAAAPSAYLAGENLRRLAENRQMPDANRLTITLGELRAALISPVQQRMSSLAYWHLNIENCPRCKLPKAEGYVCPCGYDGTPESLAEKVSQEFGG